MNKKSKSPVNWIIFCDGACSGNPGIGGWGSILSNGLNVVEMGGFIAATTNNRMEIFAALQSLRYIIHQDQPISKITIYTDSKYLINSVTEWIFGWKRNNWKTKSGEPVKNKDLFEDLFLVLQEIKNVEVDWSYVPGHSGIAGNERADQIAVGLLKKDQSLVLFKGKIEDYKYIDYNDLKISSSESNSKTDLKNSHESSFKSDSPVQAKNNKPTLGYVSFINGQIKVYKHWPQCQLDVQGKSYAKFKKFSSEPELFTILQTWKAPQVEIEKLKQNLSLG